MRLKNDEYLLLPGNRIYGAPCHLHESVRNREKRDGVISNIYPKLKQGKAKKYIGPMHTQICFPREPPAPVMGIKIPRQHFTYICLPKPTPDSSHIDFV